MNDIRRTILWVVFAFSLIMLWDQWQVHNGRQATFFPRAPAVAEAPAETVAQAAGVADTNDLPQAQVRAQAGSDITTDVGAAAQAVTASVDADASLPREQVEVRTDVFKMVFDTEGGSIIHSELLHYPESSQSEERLVLLDSTGERFYQAQSGLIGGNFPNHKTPMRFSGERSLADGVDELVLRFESAVVGDLQLVKTYTLRRGSYLIEVLHEVRNTGEQIQRAQLYQQLVRDGSTIAGGTAFYNTFTGPAFYTEEKKYQKVAFKDLDKSKDDLYAKNGSDGYVAMVQHYFASAWLPQPATGYENFARKTAANRYAAGMITPLDELAPGTSLSVPTRLFIGPQEEKMLESITPGLGLVKDYGMFTILAKPLYKLLDFIHGLLGNWGWSIVALVVLIKAAFYWLNAKAYSSMAKMKAVNPKIAAMRERLKDNPQQMQQEMMRIYREEKVNPLGGCLPIIIQIPVFIALYWVLLSSVEMRGAPWILWVKDLSIRDPLYILPLLMASTTLLQTALNPIPPDPMQARLMWIMPLVFSIMFFLFPAGLVLYWVTNNLLTIAQQWFINTRMGVPPQFNLPKFK